MRSLLAIPLAIGLASADAVMIILPAATLVSAPVRPATLHGTTTLHGPMVYLRDLFADAGANADRVLGPGPGPGGRIVVEAAQLDAIARQFRVSWRAASKADRAVLEWPGRPLPHADALAAVRAALLAAGASDDCDIELPGFVPPIVPLDAAPRPEVSQLEYDAASGRFSAVLSMLVDGIDPINTRITGRADDTIALPVPTMRLAAGTVLGPDDLHVVRVHVSLLHGEVVRSLPQAIGMQLRRQVAAGQPLAPGELASPMVVQRGATVQIQLQSPGLSLIGKAVALEAGAAGERIRVQNPSSRAVLEAEVIGPGAVRVAPSVGPLLAVNADRLAVAP
jgi:flagella basal body P-ring formation protein FlgA